MKLDGLLSYRKTLKTLSDEHMVNLQNAKLTWWFSSIILKVLPVAFVFFRGLLYYEFDLTSAISGGELVFASFDIVAPLMLDFFNANKNPRNKGFFLASFIICIVFSAITLFLYAQIKTDASLEKQRIIQVSLINFLSAILYANYSKTNLLLIALQDADTKGGGVGV